MVDVRIRDTGSERLTSKGGAKHDAQAMDSHNRRAAAARGSIGGDAAPVRWEAWCIMACLGGSASALGLAPVLMPASYSWLSHTTSESAAQGLGGAWLARFGFLAFGLAVLWLSSLAGARWGRWGKLLHRSFGVLMVATAAFSHRPFESGVVFDRTEDLLHSVTATAMGFAFAFGVVVVTLRRDRLLVLQRVLDVVAIAASIFVPLGMAAWSGYAGLLQRSMFLVAYIWYGAESTRDSQARAGIPSV
jgi:hypothetical protein